MLTTWTQAILTIVSCSSIAGLWAFFRPDLVRDNDGRRLPHSITARVSFTVLFVFFYLTMAAALLFGGFFIKSISQLVGPVPRFLQEFDNQAFVLALFACFGLYSFAPFREIERNVLSWMHDTQRLRADLEALAAHLKECAFNISVEARDRNLETQEFSGIVITDNDLRGINLGSLIAWRKTAFLLRCVREWNAAGPRVLSNEEMTLLRELEGSHTSQSRLAIEITRRNVNDNAGAQPADMLARLWQRNPKGIAQREEAAKATVVSEPALGNNRPPVRLTVGQRQQYLKKIEDGIILEYGFMLDGVSMLAAKSIVRAGSAAEDRLDQLKEAGFEGLGRIHSLSVRRILWLFLTVAVGGFLTSYVLWYDIIIDRIRELPGRSFTEEQLGVIGQTTLIGIGFFVTTIAFAGLIGALCGSTSANARAKQTPWGKYFLAGLFAVVVYFLMQLIQEAVVHASGLSDALSLIRPSTWITRIQATASWCVLPFFITVGICWLARQKPWPLGVLGEKNGAALLQPLLDGIVIAVLMLIAFSMLVVSSSRLPDGSQFDRPVMAILALLGFIVGAIVVRDARSTAHTQLVLPSPHEKEGR